MRIANIDRNMLEGTPGIVIYDLTDDMVRNANITPENARARNFANAFREV